MSREVWSARSFVVRLESEITVHNVGQRRLFSRGSWAESSRIATVLRRETVGGALLLVAAATAMTLANSPAADWYHALMATQIGPASIHLDLSVGAWAADGLLAIFFFVVGLELKREFVAGDLREPSRAALPIAAAVGGMLIPATVYVAVNATDTHALNGWAIPTATDIAFAVAVLAVIGTHLPSSLRTFLLTLAVVDDLLAILVIAAFYSHHLNFVALGLAIVPLALFALAVQRRVRAWWILLPLAFATWTLMHASGIHATVAGVLLGFTVPVVRSQAAGGPGAGPGLAEYFEHRMRPISAGVAVPLFAFCAAGVTVGGLAGLQRSLDDHVTVGVIAGLVVGKALGIFATTFVLAKFTSATLDDGLRWPDVAGVAMLGGIGFTVSLLISELAFTDSESVEHAKIGVLIGSLVAALLAAVLLRLRNRSYRRICDLEEVDADNDGVPDVFQQPR